MSRLKQKSFLFLLMIFALTCLIAYNLFVYSSTKLHSGNVPTDVKKEISEEVTNRPLMLTYGPNQKTLDCKYLIFIRYTANMPGNSYQLYTDDNGGMVYCEGLLDGNKNTMVSIVDTENVNVQVLTYFGGRGALYIKQIGIIPISVLVLIGASLLLILAYAIHIIYGNNQKATKFIQYVTQCVTIFSFCTSAYFIDCSSYLVAKVVTAILTLVGLVFLIFTLCDSIGVDELRLAISAVTIGCIELRNIVLYGFDFMVLYWTVAITVLILLVYHCFFKGVKILGVVITTIFSLYSFTQFMYSQYFNDFFTLKIIRLFTTAMEASSSIAELITLQSLSYLFILLAYYIVIWCANLFFGRSKHLADIKEGA